MIEPTKMQRLAELRKKLLEANKNKSRLSDAEWDELRALSREDRQKDIERFQNAYYWLTELLYRHDPMYLKNESLPRDEYEGEARLLLRKLAEISHTPTVLEIRKHLFEVFDQQFSGHAGRIDDEPYIRAAQEIADNYGHIR